MNHIKLMNIFIQIFHGVMRWEWKKFIKKSNTVNSKHELEFYFIKKFQKLLDFPLIPDEDFDTTISYENFIHANSILETINTSLQLGHEYNKFEHLLTWVQDAKKLAQYIISTDYFTTDTHFYLENFNDTQNDLKKSNNKNAGEIFVALNYNSDKIIADSIITRSPIDQYFFSINNKYSYHKNINFYEKYNDIKDKIPICKLELPKYWTSLYLLFDGPNTRPINYNFNYWVTWKAAEYIKDNQWKTKISVIGENNNEYCFFIKFTLDSNIAKSLKELIKNYNKNTKNIIKNKPVKVDEVKEKNKTEEKSSQEKKSDRKGNKTDNDKEQIKKDNKKLEGNVKNHKID